VSPILLIAHSKVTMNDCVMILSWKNLRHLFSPLEDLYKKFYVQQNVQYAMENNISFNHLFTLCIQAIIRFQIFFKVKIEFKVIVKNAVLVVLWNGRKRLLYL